MESDLKESLINKEDNKNEPFSVKWIEDLFQNQNINEGHSLELYKKLGVNAFFKGVKSSQQGLKSDDSADVKERLQKYGSNAKKEKEAQTFMDFVFNALEDPMLRYLLLASLVSTLIGIYQEGLASGWIEGFSIFLAVFIVVTISSIQNYSKDQQFIKLDKENNKKDVKVTRDGFDIKEISIDDLLVGDILHLNYGDIAPIDGIVVKDTVTIDESSMTGESELSVKICDVDKMNIKKNPFVISGTKVVDGTARVLVLAVGSNKVSGKSEDMLEEGGNERTALEQKLDILAEKIGELGFLASIFIGVVVILKHILLTLMSGEAVFSEALLESVLNACILAITVIVVAIPEGLPMAVTISLAFSVFKMKEENNLVRHLDASETMGNVNNVCTDKTGTITRGIMELRRVYIEEKDFHVDKAPLSCNDNTKNLFAEILANNLTAFAEKVDGKMTAKGNFTEVAILQYLIDNISKYNNLVSDKIVRRLNFNSDNKYMVTLVKTTKKNGYRLYVKGAPERLLSLCSLLYVSDSKTENISSKFDSLKKLQQTYAENSMRTLAICYRDFETDNINESLDGNDFFQPFLKELTLIALLGIADAPRPEVIQSVKSCHDAGVIVRMVTGDNIQTAIAISQDVNIITPKEYNMAKERIRAIENGDGELNFSSKIIALDGNEFREMSGGYIKVQEGVDEKNNPTYKYQLSNVDKFRKTTENLKVIARASPDDKFLLVLGLKQLGNIVAVTGDGTNDAPALKKSDVGFAMGKRGTDIAKNASDIILLDDSFSSIITAMKYGRNVYDCIRKFLQFQLTCNVVAVFMTLLGGVILKDSPLNPVQMLWVNLIMDSFASLALATEPPSDELLKRKPYPKDSDIITPTMKINIGAQSIFQIIVLTLLISYGDVLFGVPSDRELAHSTWNNVNGYHFTIFFNTFVFLQVFNSINARKLQKSELNMFENIFNNAYYLIVQGIIVLGQVIMVTYGGKALRTHPLSLNQHLGCMAIASLSLVVGVIIKLLPIGIDENIEGQQASKFSISKSIRGSKASENARIKTSRSIKN